MTTKQQAQATAKRIARAFPHYDHSMMTVQAPGVQGPFWAIVWEDGAPFDWTTRYMDTSRVTYTEPLNSCAVAVVRI